MFKKFAFAIAFCMTTFFSVSANDTTITELSSAVLPEVELVNINTADPKTIANRLEGIGLKKAQAIVEYRETNGPFTSKQALTQINGIGDKLLAKNQERISL